MSKCFPTNWFEWIDSKEFDLYKYTKDCSKGCVLEYFKNLQELHNDYRLAPHKTEIKGEMLS